MSNPAVESLKNVLGQYGLSVCQTPRMCEMMIRQSCHLPPAEVDALMAAVKTNVVTRLMTKPGSDHAQLAALLSQEAHVAPATAKWAVESWAEAIGSAPARQGPQTWKDVDAPDEFLREARRPVRLALIGLLLVGGTGLVAGALPGVVTGVGIQQRQPWALEIQQHSRMSDEKSRLLDAWEFAAFYGVLGGFSGMIGASLGWMFGGYTRLSSGRVMGAMIGAFLSGADGAFYGMVNGGAIGAFVASLVATGVGTFIATLLGVFVVLWLIGRLAYLIFLLPIGE
jgi:hypothetical protein